MHQMTPNYDLSGFEVLNDEGRTKDTGPLIGRIEMKQSYNFINFIFEY